MKKNLPLWAYVDYFKLLSSISLSVYLYFGSICVAFHLPNAVCYFAEIRASVALTVAANSHRISTTTDRLSNVNMPYNYKRSILEAKYPWNNLDRNEPVIIRHNAVEFSHRGLSCMWPRDFKKGQWKNSRNHRLSLDRGPAVENWDLWIIIPNMSFWKCVSAEQD